MGVQMNPIFISLINFIIIIFNLKKNILFKNLHALFGQKDKVSSKIDVHNSSAETHSYFLAVSIDTINALCHVSNRKISQSATYDESKNIFIKCI